MRTLTTIVAMAPFASLGTLLMGCDPLPPPYCLEDENFRDHSLDGLVDLPIVIHVSSDDLFGSEELKTYLEEDFRPEFNGFWIPSALGSGPGEPRFMLTNAMSTDDAFVQVREGGCEDTTQAYTKEHGVGHLPHVIGAFNLYFCSDVSGRQVYSTALGEMASFRGYVPEIESDYVFLGTTDPYVVLHEIGHALGLLHTHEERYDLEGDGIPDTPYDPGPGACELKIADTEYESWYSCGRDPEGNVATPPVTNMLAYFLDREPIPGRASGDVRFTKIFTDDQIQALTCGAAQKGWTERIVNP